MSALTSTDVLRPRGGVVLAATGLALRMAPAAFALLRRYRPIARFGSTYLATRYDDVVEVFADDAHFGVPYGKKLALLMDGEPFVLGMADGAAYQDAIAAMRSVMRADDLPRLADAVERQSTAIVAAAAGRIEVVDTLVRRISFDVLARYLGVPPPAGGDLRVWATRLFEYQFISSDAALVAEVQAIAPALRAHIGAVIAERRASASATDDVLGRCLVRQAAGDAWFSDSNIRTMLTGMIVGGPPQPCMVVPQALEQLLRRPAALASAQGAARANDDDALFRHVYEAMRFDPLGPGLPRVVLEKRVLAKGTARQRTIPAGATVLACFQSAMMDPRRLAEPDRFDPGRPARDYLHFGHGMHECFGRHINRAMLHLMLKPLLARSGLRRASGAAGRLRKSGALAQSLSVEFD